MTAVISSTYDDLYLFYLPITTWAWSRLDVEVICFVPNVYSSEHSDINSIEKANLVKYYTRGLGLTLAGYNSSLEKRSTYAQCSRLYAAALNELQESEVLITGDVDMAVFNKDYFNQFNDGRIHVVGADLVPPDQYPICYIAMPVKTWRDVMWMQPSDTVQGCLDRLLGDLECEHFRGNYWGKDQETIYRNLALGGWSIKKHFRAKPGTQFATRRADRDGWPKEIPPDIIDAHMPRPGYTEQNFSKILNLFQTMYPNDNFDWMIEYRAEYLKLIQ